MIDFCLTTLVICAGIAYIVIADSMIAIYVVGIEDTACFWPSFCSVVLASPIFPLVGVLMNAMVLAAISRR
jgi:hypothetical protein